MERFCSCLNQISIHDTAIKHTNLFFRLKIKRLVEPKNSCQDSSIRASFANSNKRCVKGGQFTPCDLINVYLYARYIIFSSGYRHGNFLLKCLI